MRDVMVELKQLRLHGEADAQRRFVADDGGFEQRAAARVLFFRDRERRRQHGGARVVHGADVRVVELSLIHI